MAPKQFLNKKRGNSSPYTPLPFPYNNKKPTKPRKSCVNFQTPYPTFSFPRTLYHKSNECGRKSRVWNLASKGNHYFSRGYIVGICIGNLKKFDSLFRVHFIINQCFVLVRSWSDVCVLPVFLGELLVWRFFLCNWLFVGIQLFYQYSLGVTYLFCMHTIF